MNLKTLTVNETKYEIPDPAEEIENALEEAKDSGEFDGPQGPQGPAGADGYTPVKGADYWTDADKDEMVSDVVAEVSDGDYELIETITLTEDTAYIERTEEPDGTAYSFKNVFIKVKLLAGTASGSLRVDFNGNQIISGGTQLVTSGVMYTTVTAEIKNGKFFGGIGGGQASEYYSTYHYLQRYNETMTSYSDIHSIKLLIIGGTINLPAGSVFEIWAVRK